MELELEPEEYGGKNTTLGTENMHLGPDIRSEISSHKLTLGQYQPIYVFISFCQKEFLNIIDTR